MQVLENVSEDDNQKLFLIFKPNCIFFMTSEKEKTTTALAHAKTIWKELVNNHPPKEQTVVALFSRYKTFLESNKYLFNEEKFQHLKQGLDTIESLLEHYQEVTSIREKKFLLNDAHVGLMFDVAECVEALTSEIDSEAYMPLNW